MELRQLVCCWEFGSAEPEAGIVVVAAVVVVEVADVAVGLEPGVAVVVGAVVEVADVGRR